MSAKPEVWLRGPLDNVPAMLQPVAHALLQAREELNLLMGSFPDELLWAKPAGLAPAGFHLQHLTGVLDRLFTYANQEQLDPNQLDYLKAEGKPGENLIATSDLLVAFNSQVDKAIDQLEKTDGAILTEKRGVGRAMLPSTVIGLYFHAAEHTMRHTGQLLVTVRILLEKRSLG
jgi:hypothetical protein